MSTLLVDDHLLGDLIGDSLPQVLRRFARRNDFATTNLFYYRLCRAAVEARGGPLTGHWDAGRREQASRSLLQLSDDIRILPMRDLAFRMAALTRDFQLSALGAEAVAAAEALGARVLVWSGDVGPRIRTACTDLGIRYEPVDRS